MGRYLRRVDKGEHDTVLLGWNGDTEPANTAGQLGCGSASGTFWCNPDYESCSPKPAPARPARPARVAYAKACAWPRSNCPGAPLAHGAISVPHRASIKGLRAVAGQLAVFRRRPATVSEGRPGAA